MIPLPFSTFWIKVAAAGAVLGAVYGGLRIYGGERHEAGRNEVLAQWEASKAVTAREALRHTETLFKEDQHAREAASKDLAAVRAGRDTARQELGRLQSDIADVEARLLDASEAKPACRADEAARVALELFGECASRREAVAGEAGELAGSLLGLQRWVAGVCAEPVAATDSGRMDR